MIDKFWILAQEHFFKPKGLLIIWIIVIIFCVTTSAISGWGIMIGSIITSVIIVITSLIWFNIVNKLPKTDKDKKGIFLLFDYEEIDGDNIHSSKISNRIKNDIIKKIKDELEHCGLSKKIQIHSLHKYQTVRLIDILNNYHKNPKRFKKINKKINGSYFISGFVKVREDNKYLITVSNGRVTHNTIPEILSKILAREFTSILTPEVQIDGKSEIAQFEQFSILTMIGSLYIIGMASFLSGNLHEAFEIHTNLMSFIQKYMHKYKVSDKFLEKVNSIISDEIYNVTERLIKDNKVDEAKEYNIKNYNLNKNHPLLPQQRINIEYRLGNIEEALKFNEQVASESKVLNRGFLYLASKNYQKAINVYMCDLKNVKIPRNLALDCIQNNKRLFELDNSSSFIFFINGYLSYHCVKDLSSAKENFEKFIKFSKKEKGNIHLSKFIDYSKESMKSINSSKRKKPT